MSAIVGWALSKFGKLEGDDLESLIAGTAAAAIADAGVAPGEIGAIHVGNFGGFEKRGFPASLALFEAQRSSPIMPICATSR
jgi:acetyl-CoA C-acetyltransferase